MCLDHVESVATKRAVVVPKLVAIHEHTFGTPLPARFQLSDLGRPIAAQFAPEVGGGTGAGGGTATGPVTYDVDDPPTGSVLVTTTLSPGLGPLLPRLAGIVSETGSVLSHLAILAREAGVPRSSAMRVRPRIFLKARRARRWRRRTSHHPGEGAHVMKVIAWLAGIGTLVAGGFYMVVSLNRWEWNRALFFGLIVLIAEVALATGLVLRRLARLEYRMRRPVDPVVTEHLRETRPPTPDRFAWLRDSTTALNVFITFLIGGGVILSAVAWVVDRVASEYVFARR